MKIKEITELADKDLREKLAQSEAAYKQLKLNHQISPLDCSFVALCLYPSSKLSNKCDNVKAAQPIAQPFWIFLAKSFSACRKMSNFAAYNN